MLRSRKHTFGFAIGIFLCGLGARTLWDRTHSLTSTSSSTSESLRTPAGTQPVPNIDTSTNSCQNIYQLVCQKTAAIHDPTGQVRSDVEGEKLALALYRDIIHAHRDWSIDQIDEEMAIQTFSPARRGRIESAFRWVQNDIEQFINQQSSAVFTAREKQLLKARLKKTKLELPPPASIYSDEPDLLTKNEIYYERTQEGKMRLRVGGAYIFVAKSWFNIVFTLAHELAHSIDPCEIRSVRLSFPAYDQLIGCFLQNGLIATRNNRSECGANDQLSETFADWLAVQITANALKHFSTEFRGPQIIDAARNSVKDLCEQETETNDIGTEFHPSPSVRISKIFGNNPAIRSLLGCESEPVVGPAYCTLKSFIPPNSDTIGEGPRIYEK
ncbi:MAG: hypothetical protein ABIQ95_11710 [Bdellovibrionia bacterium]